MLTFLNSASFTRKQLVFSFPQDISWSTDSRLRMAAYKLVQHCINSVRRIVWYSVNVANDVTMGEGWNRPCHTASCTSSQSLMPTQVWYCSDVTMKEKVSHVDHSTGISSYQSTLSSLDKLITLAEVTSYTLQADVIHAMKWMKHLQVVFSGNCTIQPG